MNASEEPTSGAPGGLPQVGAQSLAVRAVGSSVWSLSGQVIQVLLGLGTFAALSHWLTPVQYGLFGMAATVTGVVGIIGDAGVGAAIARRQVIDPNDEATGFWLALAGGATLTVISVVAAPLIASFYRTPAVGPLALGLAATFLLAAPARVSQAKLSRALRFRATTVISLVANVTATAVAIALAVLGAGAWSLVAQMLTTILIQGILSYALAPPRVRLRLFSRDKAREISRFGCQVSGYSTLIIVGRSLEGVFAGRLLGSGAVGLLAMGTKLVFLPAERLCASTSAVFVPTAVELADSHRQARAFQSATRFLYMLIAPFCLGAAAVAPEIIAWLPARWATLQPILIAYTAGTLFAPLNHLTYSILVTHGRSKELLTVAVILLPLAWGGAALAAWSGSVLALVAVWGGCLGLGALLQLVIAWGILSLRGDYARAALVPLACSAIMAGGVRLVLSGLHLAAHRAGLVVGAAIGAAVYAALAGMFMRADILRIADLIRRAVRPRASAGAQPSAASG